MERVAIGADRQRLRDFYGLEESSGDERPTAAQSVSTARNPLNIDGPNFDCEAYLAQLLKEKSLSELMDAEHDVVAEVKKLDSEMQTLVYENYNKFITATDTIRKMKSDFVQMEDEMDKLAQNMQTITQLSEKISTTLSGGKGDVQKLVRANNTLKNLRHILRLPTTMKEYYERNEFGLAVNAFTKAQPMLERYREMPAFKGIFAECLVIVAELKDQLRDRFKSKIGSTKELMTAVNLLLQLGEPADQLCTDVLRQNRLHLQVDLGELEAQISLKSGDFGVEPGKIGRPSDCIPNSPLDILEFVDLAASGFLSDTSLAVAAFNDLFVNRQLPGIQPSRAQAELRRFVESQMAEYFGLIERRFALESTTVIDDASLVVRGLDRFYRRLQAVSRLVPDTDFAQMSLGLISRIAMGQIQASLQNLKTEIHTNLSDIRHHLVAARNSNLVATAALSGKLGSDSSQPLAEMLSKLEHSTLQSVKSALASLLLFTAYDVTFATQPDFSTPFGEGVRENLPVAFFRHIIGVANDFCVGRGDKAHTNATLILLLSRFCANLEKTTVAYVLELCEQQFRVDSAKSQLTPVAQLVAEMHQTVQRLIDQFVETEGNNLSQLLSKSVETRDWLSSVEPRNVRAVMKRVVEDLTGIDSRVGQLYEEGVKKDRSSDSSRRTAGFHSVSSRQAFVSPGQLQPIRQRITTAGSDNPLLKKLWSDKIDYFGSVEFTKVSIMTGIVKIALKTLLECVRMKTFGRFGLQQVQVDCHYLQVYLWRFVSDENLVQHLLEEVMSSCVVRCLEATLMEPSVVEAICERG